MGGGPAGGVRAAGQAEVHAEGGPARPPPEGRHPARAAQDQVHAAQCQETKTEVIKRNVVFIVILYYY